MVISKSFLAGRLIVWHQSCELSWIMRRTLQITAWLSILMVLQPPWRQVLRPRPVRRPHRVGWRRRLRGPTLGDDRARRRAGGRRRRRVRRGGHLQPSEQIIFANSGTADSPIVLRNVPGDEVVIDTRGNVPPWDWNGVIQMIGKSFITVEGLHVVNARWFGFEVVDCQNIVLRDNSTFNTGGSGIYTSGVTHLLIEGNQVQRACQSTNPTTGSQECITLAGATDFEVAHNEVWDRTVDLGNGGEGIDAKAGCTGGRIHHNRVHDLVRLGIYVDGGYSSTTSGGRVEIDSNTVYRTGNGIVTEVETGDSWARSTVSGSPTTSSTT